VKMDGAALAARIRQEVAAEVAELGALGLATVLVGDDPASEIYIGKKHEACREAGIEPHDHHLPAETSEDDLLRLVAELNADDSVDGILVQLPLPGGLDDKAVIDAIDPAKDVDGFHPLNAGRLATGLPALIPCTPLGCILLTKTVVPSLAGCEAVVVGRSNIVGKPLAQLLLAQNATVTIAHSKTRQIAVVCRRADLLYVAAGRAELVRGDWIKPGAIVIDVGQNRVAVPGAMPRLVGDVAFAEACAVAAAVTPVPGGVGPMTIACLLANTVRAACALAGLAAPNVGNLS
jgi:methylenetetrahydrofolate dehydrogenase (NADP+)/methenyltetrahydrofolate cyclohydrolase